MALQCPLQLVHYITRWCSHVWLGHGGLLYGRRHGRTFCCHEYMPDHPLLSLPSYVDVSLQSVCIPNTSPNPTNDIGPCSLHRWRKYCRLDSRFNISTNHRADQDAEVPWQNKTIQRTQICIAVVIKSEEECVLKEASRMSGLTETDPERLAQS